MVEYLREMLASQNDPHQNHTIQDVLDVWGSQVHGFGIWYGCHRLFVDWDELAHPPQSVRKLPHLQFQEVCYSPVDLLLNQKVTRNQKGWKRDSWDIP
jgi:hypothetical protein